MPQNKASGKPTGMIIDGIAASEAIDSSGEILNVKGCDISSLENGDGLLNWEHRNEDAKGASANDIVGHIIYAKKIFKAEDCNDKRQRMYWDMVKLPFIYIKSRLYDGAGHPNAMALAAQIRDHVANNEKILCRYSIEGSTLKKDGNLLERSIARKVAVTVKPCNKSCNSGIVADPNSPFEKDRKPDKTTTLIEDILARNETGGVRNRKLAGSFTIATDPMVLEKNIEENLVNLLVIRTLSKALAAGSGGAAPSTLTGMSAMAPEHLVNRMKGIALATIRDYDKPFKKEEFRVVLKHRLPEADDSFIDHFSDLADEYHVKRSALVKKESVKEPTKKTKAAPKTESKSKTESKPKTETKPVKATKQKEPAAAPPVANARPAKPAPVVATPASEDESADGPMTIRGKAVEANPHLSRSFFDEGTGVLHTPKGSFPMYIPSRDPDPRGKEAFDKIMNDPKVSAFHDRAMENWARVNGLLKAGQLPPEVVMHGTLFSQLSPNTPVPIQELMYSHLVDSMKHKGIDARDPRFSEEVGPDWKSRDRGDLVPEQSRDYFNKLGPAVRIGKLNDKGQYYSDYDLENSTNGKRLAAQGKVPRKPGDMQSFMLANNKLTNMSKYHTLHKSLVDLVNRHRENTRAAIQELMSHKDAAKKHEAKRLRAKAKGEDIGPYPGPDVPGLAPKTGRYMYGMLGGANSVVPDTHFVRHLFGLEKGTDQPAINHIKQVLWDPNNSEAMNAIDRYYAKHHDAVKHMRQHPKYAGLFHDDESAVFPAFWKHWMSIVPHEEARGIKTHGLNADTDHTPYWEAIDPYVRKSEQLDESQMRLPIETAMQHQRWVQQFGEIPAMTLYYRYAVPRLLQAAREREAHGVY